MLDLHLLPATELPDLLIDWCGPVEWSAVPDVWRRGQWGYIGESSGAPVWGLATAGDGHDRGYSYRLDLLRPESQDHVARVMAARGTPIWHIVDAGRTNALPPLVIAQGAGWSVRSVARGGEVLRGILSEWHPHKNPNASGGAWDRDAVCLASPGDGVGGRIGREVVVCWPTQHAPGWCLLTQTGYSTRSGPETGEAGRAAADRAALAHNFATLSPSGATFPELT